MTTAFAIQTVLEILAVLFVVYGLLHEDKFVAFEEKIIRIIKKQVYMYKRRKALERKRQQGSSVKAAPARRPAATQRQRVVHAQKVA